MLALVYSTPSRIGQGANTSASGNATPRASPVTDLSQPVGGTTAASNGNLSSSNLFGNENRRGSTGAKGREYEHQWCGSLWFKFTWKQ